MAFLFISVFNIALSYFIFIIYFIFSLLTKTAIFTLYPPPTDALYDSFKVNFNKSGLTNGGRALAKHSIRDSSHFWGYSQGKVNEINSKAIKKLNQIIENSVWHNIMYLVDESYAYEIRNPLGYGARWEFKPNEPIFFRGFLEPVMENGHELKWRH